MGREGKLGIGNGKWFRNDPWHYRIWISAQPISPTRLGAARVGHFRICSPQIPDFWDNHVILAGIYTPPGVTVILSTGKEDEALEDTRPEKADLELFGPCAAVVASNVAGALLFLLGIARRCHRRRRLGDARSC